MRLQRRIFRIVEPHPRPCGLDLADPLHHQRAIAPMRATMKRQSQTKSGAFVARQQQPVHAKVMEAAVLSAGRIEHAREGCTKKQLPGQQMMALQAGLIVGLAVAIDGPKRQMRSRYPLRSSLRARDPDVLATM